MTFEQWLAYNHEEIRRIQDGCETGHVECTEPWWDTRVDLECSTCGRRPHEEKDPYKKCDCEDLTDYPPCDCNARVLYDIEVKRATSLTHQPRLDM